MKVKDLPATPLHDVKVRIPSKYTEEIKTLGTDEVYLYSMWHIGLWVKLHPKADEVYPLPISPESALEWDCV